jgi:MFS family permease
MLGFEGILPLAISAAAYGVAVSLATPAISALAIDLAPEGRLGAAVATYTVGFQLATGLSGVLWGAIIAAIGFPWPFVAAIGLQVVTLVCSRRFSGRDRRKAGSHPTI